MFELLIAISLLFFTLATLQIRASKRHDDVLYKFCELRRNAMQILRKEETFKTLSRQEYIALRKMLIALNVTIANYKTHKTVMFNLRYFMRFLREYKAENKKTELIAKTSHAEIESLRESIQSTLLFAFITYTPFIKFEIIIKLSIFLLGILVNAGWKKLNKYVTSLKEALELQHSYGLQAC